MNSNLRRDWSLLISFHCHSNTGYAIGRLEPVFLEMARALGLPDERIHFSYASLAGGSPGVLAGTGVQILEYDPAASQAAAGAAIREYARAHRLGLVFGFDYPVRGPTYGDLRRGGVRSIVGYWGAPMSSLNRGLKLLAKRLDVLLTRHRPDLYIFESEAMRATAIRGRGVGADATEVVYLGVDAERFIPSAVDAQYAHRTFDIPAARRIVYFSGHMEERKGTHVLVAAFAKMVNEQGRRDTHLLIMGNRHDEAERFRPYYAGTTAEGFITFGGYRHDVESLARSAVIGVLPSTGWDSFTMSSLEMASSGLPIVASDLQGLRETVAPGETGLLVPPGDTAALAAALARLLDDSDLRSRMSVAARARVLAGFTTARQVANLAGVVARECRRVGLAVPAAEAGA